ncbi:16S rRNA (cytidine(1402)-2'-O)-methyltransferase [Teredinibacter turnerae]|uniref:16S rRNA (cytidine(1402)-2'-O)-methyltransferase n=1 Tax=Teredinibacter turnerae TaxID=2426 RepID=UPI000370EC66|nr:16S rRNA (cytidine(1402)-2'-O)-methyltransferase [Teredinibacter turnerae]
MNSTNALYIVATPIGNLEDISKRALDVLQKADIIAAEDTRHSARLCQYFNISTPLTPYHDHSNEQQTQRLIERLAQGQNVALISDAGTPLISDPGYRLVKTARDAGYKVIPIPGACALVAALSASGLPSDRFSFEGFLPAKSGARAAKLDTLAKDPRTLIFYESPHRIEDSIRAMGDAFGAEREVVLAREISKTFETFIATTFAELETIFATDANQLKGEMVVMVHGYLEPQSDTPGISAEAEKIMAVLLAELPVRQAANIAAKITGEKKNQLYSWALEYGK